MVGGENDMLPSSPRMFTVTDAGPLLDEGPDGAAGELELLPQPIATSANVAGMKVKNKRANFMVPPLGSKTSKPRCVFQATFGKSPAEAVGTPSVEPDRPQVLCCQSVKCLSGSAPSVGVRARAPSRPEGRGGSGRPRPPTAGGPPRGC